MGNQTRILCEGCGLYYAYDDGAPSRDGKPYCCPLCTSHEHAAAAFHSGDWFNAESCTRPGRIERYPAGIGSRTEPVWLTGEKARVCFLALQDQVLNDAIVALEGLKILLGKETVDG